MLEHPTQEECGPRRPLSAELRTSDASIDGWYGLLLTALGLLLIAPIWLVDNPPLVDYPNHLARGYILYHHDQFFADYDLDFLSTPSLAMDIFMLDGQRWVDIRTVGKLFLSLTLLLWLLGWHLLGFAIHGRCTWLSLGGALFAYHSAFIYGFTNFAFGLGVFLIALAVWYLFRTHMSWPRHLLVALLALMCFFSHLAAFIFLLGSVVAITAWNAFTARKIALADIGNVVPILLPLAFLRGGGQSGLAWNWSGKLIGAFSLVRGYSILVDLGFVAALGVFVALLLLRSTRTRVVGSVLCAGLGCVALFLVGPHELFGGSPADARFLLPATALVTLSLDFTYPRRRALALLIVFLGLATFRMVVIEITWRQLDADLREQTQLMRQFPANARVYPLVKVASSPDQKKHDLASFHALGYAVIDEGIYTPTLLAYAGHQPLRYKRPPMTDHINPEPFPPAAEVDWDKLFANHTHLWTRDLPDDYRVRVEKFCTPIASKGRSTIWKINDGS